MTRLPRLPIVTCTQQLVITQGCSNRVHSQQPPCFIAWPARVAGRACSSSSRNTKSRVPLIFLGKVISATPVLGSCSARARSAAAHVAAVRHIWPLCVTRGVARGEWGHVRTVGLRQVYQPLGNRPISWRHSVSAKPCSTTAQRSAHLTYTPGSHSRHLTTFATTAQAAQGPRHSGVAVAQEGHPGAQRGRIAAAGLDADASEVDVLARGVVSVQLVLAQRRLHALQALRLAVRHLRAARPSSPPGRAVPDAAWSRLPSCGRSIAHPHVQNKHCLR